MCTAINKFAMSANSDSKEALTDAGAAGSKEMTNIPMGPVGGSEVNPCSIEAEMSNGPTPDDEDDNAGYITQLDKDGNIQQVGLKRPQKATEVGV